MQLNFATIRRRRLELAVAAVLAALIVPHVWTRAQCRAGGARTIVDLANAPEPSRETLRIGTFNIAHGRGSGDDNWAGGDREARLRRLDEIAALLREVDLDVVVLNEVDFDSQWSYGIDQAAYLAERAGYPYRVEQDNYDFRVTIARWQWGNAILSRYPLRDAARIDLPTYAAWEPFLAGNKHAAECIVDHPTGDFRVVAVHLDHRENEDLRIESLRRIARQRDDVPTVLAGDFNSTLSGFPDAIPGADGETAVDALRDPPWQIRPATNPSEGELTYATDDPRRVIDWIVIPSRWQFSDYRAIDTDLSDHRPVVAEIDTQ